ncbi:MAG TPA: peptidylprolyl isomerase [Gemmatimonadales bacterium]|nr:peptidylprolyl isomerase [Gemmatimonadales bacterium]
MLRRLVLAVSLGLLARGAAAQQVDSAAAGTLQPVDRIVAVVGTRALMRSQLDEQFYQLISSLGVTGPATAADSAKIRRQILEDMVDDELMVQQALKDTSIKVTDTEVSEAVQKTMREIRQKYPNEFEFTKELRSAGFMNLEEYRRFMVDQARRDMLRTRLTELLREKGTLKPVQPTEQEMRAFFDEQKGQFGMRPSTISFEQVVVVPQPTEQAKAQARALADSITRELRKGADFATAAKRFSQDPGSRDQGGDLGWTRRGMFVPEFEKVAFALKVGQIADPVESSFGYHIIQLQRQQPGEINARHILIVPELTEADMDKALEVAQKVYAELRAGATIDSLQRRYADPTEEREAAATPLDKLPPVYARALAEADSGSVVAPFALDQPGGRRKFAVVLVTEKRGEGEIRFEDVKDRVRARLAEDLGTRKYLTRLRQATYVDVRAI